MNPNTIDVSLRCGRLRLEIERAELSLEELCGFGSRRSRKRGFVFVSKVLGKHYPVRPRRMAETYERLARRLEGLQGPAYLIALCETATGLGHGIYEAWLHHTGWQDMLFQHTTRYRLNRPLLLDFQESHSHATQHLLYEPAEPAHAALLSDAKSLVLVDDELSTGRTLVNLATACRRRLPRLREVHLVCLTDWLGPRRRAELSAEIGLPTTVHSLLAGQFSFEPDPAFDPGTPPDVSGRGDLKDGFLSGNHGRLGVSGLLRHDVDAMVCDAGLPVGVRVLVLGTGEFAYPPFLLARRLEGLGFDVHFQSTTRSPLLVDRDIASSLEFLDNYHDAIPNYVYNVQGTGYDRILVGYETRPLPTEHALPDLLGASAVFF